MLIMGNIGPIELPIDPAADYIVSGADWLGDAITPGECGVEPHNIIWAGMSGAELITAFETFKQCVPDCGFPLSPPFAATSIDFIFGPYY